MEEVTDFAPDFIVLDNADIDKFVQDVFKDNPFDPVIPSTSSYEDPEEKKKRRAIYMRDYRKRLKTGGEIAKREDTPANIQAKRMRDYRLRKKIGEVFPVGRPKGVTNKAKEEKEAARKEKEDSETRRRLYMEKKMKEIEETTWKSLPDLKPKYTGLYIVHMFQNMKKTQVDRMQHIVTYSPYIAKKLLETKENYGWCLCSNLKGSHTHMHMITQDYSYERDVQIHKVKVEGRQKIVRTMPILCDIHLVRSLHYVSCARASNSNMYKNRFFDKEVHQHFNLHGVYVGHSTDKCTDLMKYVMAKSGCDEKSKHKCICYDSVDRVVMRQQIRDSKLSRKDQLLFSKRKIRKLNKDLYDKHIKTYDGAVDGVIEVQKATASTSAQPDKPADQPAFDNIMDVVIPIDKSDDIPIIPLQPPPITKSPPPLISISPPSSDYEDSSEDSEDCF